MSDLENSPDVPSRQSDIQVGGRAGEGLRDWSSDSGCAREHQMLCTMDNEVMKGMITASGGYHGGDWDT